MPFWRKLFRDEALVALAQARYTEIVRQSRSPTFYRAMGVPDSLDGRFEMLCLHAFLVFRKLKGGGEGAKKLSQAIYDEMFQDLDAGLRELGAADIGLGRRVKAMTEGLNGRILAYERGLAAGHQELRDAVRRNVFGTVTAAPEDVEAMTCYLESGERDLERLGWERLMDGLIMFPDPAQHVANLDRQH